MQPKVLNSVDLENFMQERGIDGKIHILDVPTPTVELAAKAVNVEPDAIVKSILFLVDSVPVLVIARGTTTIDRSAVAKTYGVGKKRVKLAPPDVVLSQTGYEVGAMPPFGHIKPIPTIMDPAILEQETVYAGGGAENALLRLNARAIAATTGAQLVSVQPQSQALDPDQA